MTTSEAEIKQTLRQIREDTEAGHEAELEAERNDPSYDPFPEGTTLTRPNRARSKVLQVRLNPDEYEAVQRVADERELPASTLARGWIIRQLRGEPTLAEIVHRLERLEARQT